MSSTTQTRLFGSPSSRDRVVDRGALQPDSIQTGDMATVLYRRVGDQPMYRNQQPSFADPLPDTIDWTNWSSTTGILRESIPGPDDRNWYVLRDQRNFGRMIEQPVYDQTVPESHVIYRHPVDEKPVWIPPVQTAPMDQLEQFNARRRRIDRYQSGTDRTVLVNGFRGIITSKGSPATPVPMTIGITTVWTRSEWSKHSFDPSAYCEEVPGMGSKPYQWGTEFLDKRTKQVVKMGPKFTLYPEGTNPEWYNPSNNRL